MEALSDAVLVADGARLPVHSQVLSLQSGVLRGLFADCGVAVPSRKRKAPVDSEARSEARWVVG